MISATPSMARIWYLKSNNRAPSGTRKTKLPSTHTIIKNTSPARTVRFLERKWGFTLPTPQAEYQRRRYRYDAQVHHEIAMHDVI